VIDELLPAEFNTGIGRPQEIKSAISWWLSVVPDSRLSIEELIAEGDKVVMRWTVSGTNQGPDRAPDGAPMPPTGKSFTYTGITINQVMNGKIVADVYENGWANMLIQMGRITS
jgi:predicted ester cyclase